MRFSYSWLISAVIANRVASAVRFMTVIDVILVLLGLLGLFGLVLRQSNISSPVITLLWLFFVSNLSSPVRTLLSRVLFNTLFTLRTLLALITAQAAAGRRLTCGPRLAHLLRTLSSRDCLSGSLVLELP